MKCTERQQQFIDEVIDELRSTKNTNDIRSSSHPCYDEIARIAEEYFEDDDEKYKMLERAFEYFIILIRQIEDD